MNIIEECTQSSIRSRIKSIVPGKFIQPARLLVHAGSLLSFLTRRDIGIGPSERARLIRKFYRVNKNIKCVHSHEEMIRIATESLSNVSEGCMVEAGCYKGGSTSKLSILAKKACKKLYTFDSFKGIPDNQEKFSKGSYKGSTSEVKENVERYGEIECCKFVEGWFDETMPSFEKKISLAYLDVDLSTSTKCCIKNLWPLISEGGVLFSQDGHIKPVVKVLEDKKFWKEEVGAKKPYVHGLGEKKLVYIKK
ncbi:TylF/MycF/NovP-related O-methyltransferase [Salinibacter ruber]|uniref:TylF/MycF/NovP-related O-methyltransferase n=1 Tax=Salinibacter ruber TaxID=146919 RepID=UPI00161DB506|nr:TylF/MycF/NovP-related O-methyltransferase [Salinibacter ruber]MBB4091156.1 O-methyltransferase [Salinibacter ruber]